MIIKERLTEQGLVFDILSDDLEYGMSYLPNMNDSLQEILDELLDNTAWLNELLEDYYNTTSNNKKENT